MNTKKIFLPFIILCFLAIIFIPLLAKADIVQCGNGKPSDANYSPCTICDFFQMLVNVYSFIVLQIATPLAIIAIIVGGILMMLSAGNPNLMSKGKTILYAAIIGLFLVFGSWLIIDFVLNLIGYSNASSWSSLNLNCSGGSK